MYRLFVLCLILFLNACQKQAKPKTALEAIIPYKKINGITMGVVAYQMKYQDEQNLVSQGAIDSLLAAFNQGNSHYEPSSTLSRFNQSENGITIEQSGVEQHFIKNVLLAETIVRQTAGYFDPTVGPLMKYYGFRRKGIEGVAAVDTLEVRRIMQMIGFDKIEVKQVGNQFVQFHLYRFQYFSKQSEKIENQ